MSANEDVNDALFVGDFDIVVIKLVQSSHKCRDQNNQPSSCVSIVEVLVVGVGGISNSLFPIPLRPSHPHISLLYLLESR